MRYVLLTILILIALPLRGFAHQRAMSPETVALVEAATLVVRSGDLRDRFLGSAVVFGPSGQAVTNAHVVGRARVVDVVTSTGQRMRASVIRRDKTRDLALLQLPDRTIAPLLPRHGDVHPGLPVYAIGAPLEAVFSLSSGIISARARQIDATQPLAYVQHDAPVNPGSSGGALVDVNGHLIGLNTRISDGSRYFVGLAYAISTHDLAAFLKREETPMRAAPGFLVRPLDMRMRAALEHVGDGVLIEAVHPDSPAAEAGLMAGDIMTGIDGHPMRHPGDVAFALAKGGYDITLSITRRKRALTLDLSLHLRPTAGVAAAVQPIQSHETYSLADMGLAIGQGGRISAVAQQGRGFFAGLSVGDRILAINGTPADELGLDWQGEFRFDAPILIRISLPDGATQHYVLDPWDAGNGLRLASGANVLDQEVIGFDEF